ncbi:MAG: hypothetical protein Ct9H90mV1_0570 [Prasinovirus sp.]|nr:MAG: hypothetical protein Ct9H90mV1_0570 [Prasinovirus sp.]|tara:strand:- start:124 stop:537 length:414 start_codon:yes stop_codon:yes gene_type:complete
MSLLIFSPQCNHSLDIISYINKHESLKQIVSYHNINKLGIPPQFKNKISRVPTMLTKNGKLLVGNEIKNWLESLLPVRDVEMAGFGSCSMTTLDGEGTDELYDIDSYGMSLQPAMTPELEEKISRSVSDAYNSQTKQ